MRFKLYLVVEKITARGAGAKPPATGKIAILMPKYVLLEQQ